MKQMLEAIKSYYTNDFGRKTLVVGKEVESRQIKNILFGLGAKVVSDRDVVTLDYLISQKLMQEERVRIVEDYIYPYLNPRFTKGKTSDLIKIAKSFPDPFVEEGILDVLRDFFLEVDGGEADFQRLESLDVLFKEALSGKLIPRSFIKLCLFKVLDQDRYIFLDNLVATLPSGLRDRFAAMSLAPRVESFEWSKQIDLYEHFNQENFSFKTFSSQIEEVRYVLNLLASEKAQGTNFLYPSNSGYELLFFIYQNEFFSEQVFFFNQSKKSELKNCIDLLKSKTKRFHTNYDRGFENKNKFSVSTVAEEKASLELVLREFNGKFTEHDLNLLSPLVNQMDGEMELTLTDWIEIFSEISRRDKMKNGKLITDLPLIDYRSAYLTDEISEVCVLGWGDHLFKRDGEKFFSAPVLSALERDLGFEFVGLNLSSAKELINGLGLLNLNIRKTFLYSEKTAGGSSVKPGVLKILLDTESDKNELERNYIIKPFEVDSKQLEYTENKVSASSLQRFDECPYKFYLEKVLNLNFEDQEDYFLSAKEEGLLIHKALEDVKNKDLTKEQFQKTIEAMIFSDDEEMNFFRSVALPIFVDKLWSICQEEKAYIKDKEISKTEVEKFFSFKADETTKTFSKDGEGYKVVGLVDRIDFDKDQKGAFLYDYKRGDTGSVSLSRYSGAKLSPQLFLYCIAADRGFLGKFEDFLGFQYINVKDYKRSKGFVSKEKGVGFSKETPQGSLVTQEKYDEKLEKFLENFWGVLERLSKNEFPSRPNPAYSGTCANCTWVGICKKSETFQ